MKERKLIKTYANISNGLFKLIKSNINDPYFLEVLYYHVRKALILKDYDLHELDAFRISGKYLGYDVDVELNRTYDNVLRSLNLVLSLRAFMIDSKYIKYAFDDKLLFYNICTNYLTWDSHRVIMECIGDEDFSSIYDMIVSYKNDRAISEEQINLFKEKTIDPGYHHQEEFCKILAARDEYHGRSVIKNNAHLYDDMDEFVVDKGVEYIGNTAFAYCEYLEKIKFGGKVLFGKFPIIECKNLKRIIVPTDLLDYYKGALPYYKDIITDNELEEHEEPDVDEQEDDLEIEHVYVGVPSADPYIEKEVGEKVSKPSIDYTVLKRVFDKKATSYKFFWFLAILDIYYNRRQIRISFKNIVAKMAAYAWDYIFNKNMDFGSVDQMKKYLIDLKDVANFEDDAKVGFIEEMILEKYDSLGIKKILSPLLKNVPYRFLSPWITFTTQDEVIQKSYDYKKYHGVYAIYDEGIVLNAEWLEYFRNNYDEIRDFIINELEKAYADR
jgi:hypothetical protein